MTSPTLPKTLGVRDLVLFNEYFHGDSGRGLGASHQTGWTALVTRCLELEESVTQREQIAEEQKSLAAAKR